MINRVISTVFDENRIHFTLLRDPKYNKCTLENRSSNIQRSKRSAIHYLKREILKIVISTTHRKVYNSISLLIYRITLSYFSLPVIYIFETIEIKYRKEKK